MLKIVVVEPIPRARIATTARERPGRLASAFRACRRSYIMVIALVRETLPGVAQELGLPEDQASEPALGDGVDLPAERGEHHLLGEPLERMGAGEGTAADDAPHGADDLFRALRTDLLGGAREIVCVDEPGQVRLVAGDPLEGLAGLVG